MENKTPKTNSKGSQRSHQSKLSEKRLTTLERPITKTEIDERVSKQQKSNEKSLKKTTKVERSERKAMNGTYNNKPQHHEPVEREEEIYGDSSTLQRHPRARNDDHEKKWWADGSKMKEYYDQDLADDAPFDDNDEAQDMNFYDDDSLKDIMMKSIKRQDILKQYYSSGTDTERLSTSSDPYDCIVVEDHLVSAADLARKNKKNKKSDSKMEFSTFRSNKTETSSKEMSGKLLPRTKLNKSSGESKYESGHDSNREQQGTQGNKKRSKNGTSKSKQSNNYSQWVDLWGNTGAPPTKTK